MNIKYKITFFGDWHCGSGLSSGVDVDLLVIKDENNLPFIPGKTIKGLVREAVEEIDKLSKSSNNETKEMINQAFGYFDKNSKEATKGLCFFTNAELNNELKNKIIEAQFSRYLYRRIASTAINDEGVAEEHSLRQIEVTIPCELYGTIKDVPEKLENTIIKGLKFVKRLGQNRNRGLGRCSITIVNEGGTK
jgi:CRISPR/Cas system CSM-associated protein Csm3 (group 7 of RAMP superfamily)